MKESLNVHISRKLKEITTVLSVKSSAKIVNDFSLMEGLAGKILFNCYHQLVNKNMCIDELTDNVELLVSGLNSIDKIESTNFYSGISGWLWALKRVEHLNDYEIFDNDDLEYITRKIFTDSCVAAAKGNYDFFLGSIGRYMFLVEAKRPHNINKFIDILLRTGVSNNNEIFWTCSMLDKEMSVGQFLGLAHGNASLIMFFNILIKEKIINGDEVKNIVEKLLCNTLKYKSRSSSNMFPSHISEKLINQNTRLAWCHGDLGIAAAIFNAGVTFNNAEWLNEAYDILHHIYSKRTNLEENGIYDANICHGAAGVAHIFNKVYQYSKIPEFKTATELWIEHTLSFAKYDDGLAGFKTYDNEKGLVNSTGLLTGISGIGLVLLSYLYPETVNTWDRCLLLS